MIIKLVSDTYFKDQTIIIIFCNVKNQFRVCLTSHFYQFIIYLTNLVMLV